MRALGARLGADPTGVYRYFRTKDELLDAMAVAALAGDRPVRRPGGPPTTSPPPSRTSAPHCWPTPALLPVVARRPPGADRVMGLDTGGLA
jgi:hypothetical protein